MPAPISFGVTPLLPHVHMRAASHIAIVVHSLNRGGAQRRLMTLANAFVEAGREVDVVALRRDGDVDQLLDKRVRVTVLNERPRPIWKPWTFEGWGALTDWLRHNRPDIVLAGVNTVHGTASVAARRIGQGRPLLALRASQHPIRHFPWSRPFKRLREPIERRFRKQLYDRADLVIAVSREVRDAVRRGMRVPEHCIDLPNPVVTPGFIESLNKPADHPWLQDGAPVILAVGRTVWSKRFDILIDALAIVRQSIPARLIILGDGKLRAELVKQAARLGLDQAVALPGNVQGVGSWIAGADLLVSTSVYEGSPAVLIEALAAGVPVVATRCPGGSEELLGDGVGGSLIPLNDADATARAILAELGYGRDPALLREKVSGYTVEASAAAYLAALDRAVAERGEKNVRPDR